MLTLNFSSVIPDTVRDKDNEGTGFTSVQANKNGTQNAPSLINLDPTTGNLILTATQGTSAGNTNTLKNALQVGINATQTFTAGTRLIGPLTNLTTSNQQGGIFFGPNQDNNVKLVVANTGSGTGGLKIQLYKEENGVTSSPINVATGLNWADIRTLDLYLTGDPVNDTISAAYRINSNDGARIAQNSWKFKVNNPTRFFTNTTSARAGILASTGNAKNVPVTFSSFGIAQNVKINFQPNASVVPAGYLKDSGAAYDAVRGYGWVNQSTGAALDISDLARDRNRPNADQRIDTLLHMQSAGRPAAWEYAVPNGTYNVTVSVGDQANAKGVYDSQHTIRVEGDTVINQFQGTDTQKYQLASATVKVTDGRLTIDALGGTNTKINYLDIVNITPGNHPSIPDSSPRTRVPGVKLDAAVIVDVALPNVGQGVDAATLNSTNVRLYRTFDNAPVAGNINTSGGGDTIVFQPTQRLQANTNYTFRISEGVRDESGATFQPFSTTFTTGTDFTRQTPGVSFKSRVVFQGDSNPKTKGDQISSLVISPDGSKLYAATLDGAIRRWNITANGSLTGLQTFTSPALNNRAIIGITFDPNNPKVLWISNNAPIFTEQPAEDFTGKITKLTLGTGTSFNATVQDYVVGLPRSTKDHLTESIAFGPDGKLYVSQGSNSAMGAIDPAWNRAETLLSAAILQIDPRRTAPKGGFDVQTEAGNSYNPFAANAPVKIYATGVRNAYDLVWHTNGNLYAPTNGSAAGGNTPGDPTTAANEGLKNVATQHDYLFNIKQGGYYGHPNPKRQEYIMNGGNPTAGVDDAEVVKPFANSPYAGYADGTPADPNYRGFAYDFGRNRSPNGIIQYKSNKFGGALKNKLLVAEYSAGDDILALTPNRDPNLVVNGKPVPVGDVVPGSATRVFSGLKDPLDLIENTKNGNLYVAELPRNGELGGQITLLS